MTDMSTPTASDAAKFAATLANLNNSGLNPLDVMRRLNGRNERGSSTSATTRTNLLCPFGVYSCSKQQSDVFSADVWG
jgi:hypothetical protein